MNDQKFQLERVPGSPVSDEEIIADIRRVAELASPEAVSFRLYSKLGNYHPSTASVRFGTWNDAVVAAGLEVGNERNIPDERLFENLTCRFHSWTRALEQFAIYANTQGVQPPAPVETAGGRQTGRSVSLRTRFRMLKRDNFTCRTCGASPALTPGLSLHVDHVKAWSLGGETIEENLQTLCEACNLGKSNVL